MKTFLQDFHRLINFGELLVELGDILAYHFQWRLNIEVRFLNVLIIEIPYYWLNEGIVIG
jgi:hypothetical protein